MGRLEKRAALAQEACGLMQILEVAVAYTEGISSQEAKMKNLQAKLVVSKKALPEKDKALKLFEEESGKLSEERRVLLLKREGIEGKVATLTAEITPVEDEPEDTKDLKTRAKLVARFQLVVDDAQDTFEGSIDNVVN